MDLCVFVEAPDLTLGVRRQGLSKDSGTSLELVIRSEVERLAPVKGDGGGSIRSSYLRCFDAFGRSNILSKDDLLCFGARGKRGV